MLSIPPYDIPPLLKKTALLTPEKLIIGPILLGQIAFSNAISVTSRGPTPLRTLRQGLCCFFTIRSNA